jgi:serine/threonine-protein kinase
VGESTLFVDDRLGLQVANLALRDGIISPEEWTNALAQQAAEAAAGRPSRSICAVLIARGSLTRLQLRELRKKAEARPPRRPEPSILPPPPPRPRESGRFGKYLLLRELGRGGRGVVYEALDPELGRRVALKILRDAPGSDPAREREWFLRESRVTATLPRHPSIVPVYETGVTRGTRYVAMERIQGVEMNRWAPGRPRAEKVALLRAVARAIHEAHEYGIVHRDLKPRNILVDASGTPHVTDFGTARSVRQDSRSSLEAWGAFVGTALYLSPEQAQGAASADRRSDVYALGVMLYEALTGRPPFEGDTVHSTFLEALKREVRRPSSVVDASGPLAVDRTIETICLKAMARQPRDRYASAADLADDLDAWLSGRRVRVGLPLGRRTLLVAAAVAAATACAAGLFFGRKPPDSPTHP